VINEQSRAAMKKLLEEVRNGTFAREWIEENENGRPTFTRRRAEEAEHQIERVGRELRRMMPFVNPREVLAGSGGA
jgi:ketol-acid reductoisomerase